MADKQKVTVDITTGVGTLSFPHVFASTATAKTDNAGNPTGEKSYDIQIIIPKTQKDDIRALLKAIKTVGEAKWGDNWRKVRQPLRDGDKEAGDLTEDGSTKGEKYPERLGCYFINARSNKPVGVYARDRSVIDNPDDLYGGCKGKINVTFYPYSTQGNHGIAAGLNGVQKIADGEPFGGGKPTAESMFDMLDDDDIEDEFDLDAEDEEEVEEAPAKKAPAKKTAAKKAPAKKAAAKKTATKKKKAEPEPEEDDLDLLDEEDEDDLLDEFDDLDEEDED